jgi:hypothetical protein
MAPIRRTMRHLLRVIVLTPFTILLGTASAHAQNDQVVELGVMFWKPSPELTLSTDTLAGAGVDEIEFVQEFGIEDKSFPEFRVTAGRNHKLRASFVTFTYEAEATITRRIVFQGRVFNIGVPATADIEWKLYKFGYEWDFVSRERGFFGLIADLKYNRVEAAVDSPALTEAATAEVTAPIPAIGVIGRGYLAPAFSVTGEFSALSLNRGDDEGSLFDFDVYGMVNLGRNVGVQAGYRSVAVDYIVDEDTGDLKMKGLYFGAVVKF